MKKYIIALDQGTTSSRAMVFDHEGNIIASAQKELTQIYPRPAMWSRTRWRSMLPSPGYWRK